MDLHDGTPFWPRRNGNLAVHPPLSADERCDVVVVGAGITGSLIALELTRRGLDVVVLDRQATVAGGSTSASTSMLQYEIDELLVDLIDAIGPDDAMTASASAIGASTSSSGPPRRRVTTADSDARRVCSSAIRRRDVARLRRELDARSSAGFDVRWLDGDDLRTRWGLIVGQGAIESTAGASVDPYQLSHRTIATVEHRGGRVFDRTEVTAYDHSPRRVRLSTGRGYTVTAQHAVIATGYEVERLLPDQPFTLDGSVRARQRTDPGTRRSTRTACCSGTTTIPTSTAARPTTSACSWAARTSRTAIRCASAGALATRPRSLAAAVPRRFPGVGPIEVAFSWCGTFAETPDGLAYIGSHSRFPRCHFTLGFGGNGMTYSALAAQYIAQRLSEGSYPDEAHLFDLERPVIRPS